MTKNHRQKLYRIYLKVNGICVDCRKNDAGEGHVVCPTCRFKRRLREEKRVQRMCLTYQPLQEQHVAEMVAKSEKLSKLRGMAA